MKELLKKEKVQRALVFLKEDDDRTLQETLEMCQIPAPSYQEEKKAEYVRKRMLEAGLEDVHVDEVGNILGTRKGISDGPRILLAGHTDTVFSMDTDLTLKQEGNRYSCPGIGDDTRAVAELLSIARAMVASGIRGEGDIVFCANVCEEGLGDLRGSKYLFSRENSQTKLYDGFVSIDDKHTAGIIYQAVGSERYQVNFHGTGGPSYTGFGIPNPIHAMGRAIAKISDFQVPSDPKTTFSVGVVNGGTSVNVISAEASMLVDMRSVDPEALKALSRKFHQAVNEAVEEENARWTVGNDEDAITMTMEQKGKRPAGTQVQDCTMFDLNKKNVGGADVYGLLPDDEIHLNGWFSDYIFIRGGSFGSTFFNVSDLDLDSRILIEPCAVLVHAVERAKTIHPDAYWNWISHD